MYPGSPSPVLPRRPAGNVGGAGLGEAGYKGGYKGRVYPGSPSPVLPRRPAGNLG